MTRIRYKRIEGRNYLTSTKNMYYTDLPYPELKQEKLYRVARAQRMMNWAIASQLLTLPVPYVALVTLLFLLWAIYRLGVALEHEIPWLLALCSILPLFGLYVLYRTSCEATDHLRQAGIKVGIMGVHPDTIAHLKATR